MFVTMMSFNGLIKDETGLVGDIYTDIWLSLSVPVDLKESRKRVKLCSCFYLYFICILFLARFVIWSSF